MSIDDVQVQEPINEDEIVEEVVGEDDLEEIEEAGEELEEQAAEMEEETKEMEEEIKELKKKLKLKVFGKEVEDEIDFNDEEGLKKRLQKSHAFDKVSQEHAAMKKQVSQLVQLLQENPFELLKQAGHNVDELSEKYIEQQIEKMKKSPEQLAQEEMQAELERLRKEKEEFENKAREAELEQKKNQIAAEIENDILVSLKNSNTVLPESPLVIKKIGENMLVAMQNGYNNVTPKDVIPIVEKQFRDEIKQLFGKLPESTLEDIIGKDNLTRIRKRRIKKNIKPTSVKQIGETGKKIEEEKPKKAVSYKDFFNLIE